MRRRRRQREDTRRCNADEPLELRLLHLERALRAVDADLRAIELDLREQHGRDERGACVLLVGGGLHLLLAAQHGALRDDDLRPRLEHADEHGGDVEHEPLLGANERLLGALDAERRLSARVEDCPPEHRLGDRGERAELIRCLEAEPRRHAWRRLRLRVVLVSTRQHATDGGGHHRELLRVRRVRDVAVADGDLHLLARTQREIVGLAQAELVRPRVGVNDADPAPEDQRAEASPSAQRWSARTCAGGCAP